MSETTVSLNKKKKILKQLTNYLNKITLASNPNRAQASAK